MDEPEAIRHLKKKALYKMLSAMYLLPEEDSKGVNRRYLANVYMDVVYRIDLMTYKRFEVELTAAQVKKAPFLSSADVFAKIERLLVEAQLNELGFILGLYPEDTWLYKVARYLDKANVAGIFILALPLGPDDVQSYSSQMVTAKRTAETYLIGAQRDTPIVFQSVKCLWESHKREVARRVEIAQLTRELGIANNKLVAESAAVQANLVKAALIVYTSGTGQAADGIFVVGPQAAENRLQLQSITDM